MQVMHSCVFVKKRVVKNGVNFRIVCFCQVLCATLPWDYKADDSPTAKSLRRLNEASTMQPGLEDWGRRSRGDTWADGGQDSRTVINGSRWTLVAS